MPDQETIQLSDEAAVVYERDFLPAIFGQWPPVLADAARRASGDCVLDVGCGTGVFAREALARVGPAGTVAGLDVNDSMLSVAQRVRPEIEWHQGDAQSLPFDDGSFDVAASQFVLMFVADRAKMLREMWRVLAPGGRLCVAVWAPIERSPGYLALADIARRHLGEEGAAAMEAPFVLGEADEVLALCDSAGIAEVRLETHDGWARFPSIEEFVRIEIKGWVLADSTGEDAYQALVAEAREILAGACDDEGKLAFRMDAHVVSARKA